ncbi:MAG: manganese-binding transcriptional regulator MntR [Phycisphaerales bacterium]
MAGDSPNARAHQRVRHDHSTETAEDYVEAVAEIIESADACRVRDLAERFGVSHVTVIRTIKRLECERLVRTEPYKPIELTAKGRKLARQCKERHETVVRFLLAIGISRRVAETDAEGIEHHVSKETLARFKQIAEKGGF